ncbi:PcfJ domain-containing protein [Photobacterium leiognathi]|uniref:PcfJ domain-containing protein n=1 Tax=Photobacterium leiognathi TaxID=553611 RepID=UPI002982A725|nr:PcfJ domain-containing protein [Photobacterium leiognathi]
MNSENLPINDNGNIDLINRQMPDGFVLLEDFLNTRNKINIPSKVDAVVDGSGSGTSQTRPIIKPIFHVKHIDMMLDQLRIKNGITCSRGLLVLGAFNTAKKIESNIGYVKPKDVATIINSIDRQSLINALNRQSWTLIKLPALLAFVEHFKADELPLSDIKLPVSFFEYLLKETKPSKAQTLMMLSCCDDAEYLHALSLVPEIDKTFITNMPIKAISSLSCFDDIVRLDTLIKRLNAKNKSLLGEKIYESCLSMVGLHSEVQLLVLAHLNKRQLSAFFQYFYDKPSDAFDLYYNLCYCESLLTLTTKRLNSVVRSFIDSLFHSLDVMNISEQTKINTCLAFIDQRDPLAINECVLLQQYGMSVNQIFKLRSNKHLCKLLIGTSHKVEVQALVHFGNDFAALTDLLRQYHTNQYFKFDRYNYLIDLAMIVKTLTPLQLNLMLTRHDINSTDLDNAITLLSDGKIKLTAAQLLSSRDAIDTILSLSALSVNEQLRTNAIRYFKTQSKLLNQEDMLSQGFLDQIHDYAYNACLNPISSVVKSFPVQRDNITIGGYEIEFANNEQQLRLFGSQLKHCVGSKPYQKAAVKGDIFFIAKPCHSKGDKIEDKGFVAHLDKETLQCLQSRGFANRTTNKVENNIITKTVNHMKENIFF